MTSATTMPMVLATARGLGTVVWSGCLVLEKGVGALSSGFGKGCVPRARILDRTSGLGKAWCTWSSGSPGRNPGLAWFVASVFGNEFAHGCQGLGGGTVSVSWSGSGADGWCAKAVVPGAQCLAKPRSLLGRLRRWRMAHDVGNHHSHGVGNGPRLGHGILERVPGFEKMSWGTVFRIWKMMRASGTDSG